MNASKFIKGGAAQLKQTMLTTLSLAFPDETVTAIKSSLEEGKRRLPSSSTIKAHFLTLDVGQFLKRQAWLESCPAPHFRYLWMDSSPQIGRNWLWIQEHAIRQDKALEVLTAMWSIIPSLQRWADGPEGIPNDVVGSLIFVADQVRHS